MICWMFFKISAIALREEDTWLGEVWLVPHMFEKFDPPEASYQ